MSFSYLGVLGILSTFHIVKAQKWLQGMALQVTAKQSYSVLKENFNSSSKVAVSSATFTNETKFTMIRKGIIGTFFPNCRFIDTKISIQIKNRIPIEQSFMPPYTFIYNHFYAISNCSNYIRDIA